MTRNSVVTVLILTLVVGVAAWSKLRFVGREGYHDPQRWRVQDYPGLQEPQTAGAGSQHHPVSGG
jgi:hypothetical protein